MAWFPFRRREIPDSSPPAPRLNLLGGRYRVGRKIGSGSAGEVYEALDLRTGGMVAIKRIPIAGHLPVLLRDEWLARLHREGEVSQRLNHPDVLSIHEVGLTHQEAWLAMDRVHGSDLGRYIQSHRLLPEAIVVDIGARVAAVLGHAHSLGIFHRDLKPSNVIIDLGSGSLKLIDFGVARTEQSDVTRTGMSLGTPAYMAPEMLGGAPAGPATDTYALGVMLYELLSGQRPHQAETLGDLLRAMHREPPIPLAQLRPDLPGTVAAAVEQLLANDPASRPADLLNWSRRMAALSKVMSRASNATSLEPTSPNRDRNWH